jgi:hypothetical protein
MFRDVTPCSPVKFIKVLEERTSSIFRVEERTEEEMSMKEAANVFNVCFLLNYASTLKTEAICSSETPVDT